MNCPLSSFTKLLALVVSSICLGCGDTAKDIQIKRELLEVREKQLIDSTRSATQAFLEQRQKSLEDSTRTALERQKAAKDAKLNKENETKRRETDKEALTNLLQSQETELLIAQVRLEDIKRPRLLRTVAEKEQLLRQQIRDIQITNASIGEVRRVLILIDDGKPYEMPQFTKSTLVSF